MFVLLNIFEEKVFHHKLSCLFVAKLNLLQGVVAHFALPHLAITCSSFLFQNPSVDSYCMKDIESRLGLSRNHLQALALLVGCDYCPKGVPGIGKTQAIKFCTETSSEDVLAK